MLIRMQEQKLASPKVFAYWFEEERSPVDSGIWMLGLQLVAVWEPLGGALLEEDIPGGTLWEDIALSHSQ